MRRMGVPFTNVFASDVAKPCQKIIKAVHRLHDDDRRVSDLLTQLPTTPTMGSHCSVVCPQTYSQLKP